jgi:hypothetical protein
LLATEPQPSTQRGVLAVAQRSVRKDVAVRTSPLLGTKAWFGPHRIGWGLGPASIEGWSVTALAVLAGRIARRWPKRSLKRSLPSIALVAIALLKGTAPGGPRAYRAYRQARDHRQ